MLGSGGSQRGNKMACVSRPGSWQCPPLAKQCALSPRSFNPQICGFNVPRGWGDGILNLKSGPLPKRIPLTVVVGAPLRLPEYKGDLRSEEGRRHVDACHTMYCHALQELYDAHKEKYAPDRKRDMRFVE